MDLQMKPFTVISMQSKKPSNQVDMKGKLEIVIKACAVECGLAASNVNYYSRFVKRVWNFFVFVGCITPDVNVSRVNGIHK